ncbi:hypothetical protein K0I73_07530 [Shewanella mesophila]|uniref:hypothetical protein n=1 Tax=Shewanella mesophila TaxID=2864208 RepID=UPI001C6552F3|nr:hypothetical protein [Shewanella mesophila]QYJ88161.1 hypothetical protein K0I73_07530 [Shewanella mesophila]
MAPCFAISSLKVAANITSFTAGLHAFIAAMCPSIEVAPFADSQQCVYQRITALVIALWHLNGSLSKT